MPCQIQPSRLERIQQRGWKRPIWYIVWHDRATGRQKRESTGTSQRETAEKYFADWLARRGARTGQRDPSEILISELLADYAADVETRSETGEVADPGRIADAITALLPFCDGKTVTDIKRKPRTRDEKDFGHAYRDHRKAAGWRPHNARPDTPARPIKDSTIRRELGVVVSALELAENNDVLPSAPKVWLPPKKTEEEKRWLRRAEAAALLWAARMDARARLHLPLFIVIGLYTGARAEAILSLRWTEVDLDGELIDFNQPGRIETGKRRPRQPIPPQLLTFLRLARRRGTPTGFVVHRNGRPLRQVRHSFATAARRAGLTGVTPHSLKHTCITWLLRAGVSEWDVSGWTDTSVETIRQVYGHHCPDYLADARSAFANRRAGNPHINRTQSFEERKNSHLNH